MKHFLIFLLFVSLSSCQKQKVKAEFIEINNNIARFDIINSSNRDIEKITFEISYFDPSDNVLRKDTVNYQKSKENAQEYDPFLKANEKTFIVQSVPNNCDKAGIKILKVVNSDLD